MPHHKGGRSRVSARIWRTRSARAAIPIKKPVRPAARIATTSRDRKKLKVNGQSGSSGWPFFIPVISESVTVRAFSSVNSRSTWPDVPNSMLQLIFTAEKETAIDAEAEALQRETAFTVTDSLIPQTAQSPYSVYFRALPLTLSAGYLTAFMAISARQRRKGRYRACRQS